MYRGIAQLDKMNYLVSDATSIPDFFMKGIPRIQGQDSEEWRQGFVGRDTLIFSKQYWCLCGARGSPAQMGQEWMVFYKIKDSQESP